MNDDNALRVKDVHFDFGNFDLFDWALAPVLAREFFKCIEDAFTSYQLAENCMFLVKVRRWLERDIEL